MKKTILAISVVLFTSAAVAAEVNGGSVNFNGNMVAGACVVSTLSKSKFRI